MENDCGRGKSWNSTTACGLPICKLDVLLGIDKIYVTNIASYCVEVENGALMFDVARSWKMILGGHGRKSLN